jgi:1-acyl-sn-glycerol-3-phosphate acyltransferase
MESNVPVVPITISGSHSVMPKQRFAIKPGLVTVIFHDPIEPKEFGSREELMEKVRRAIDSGLPEEYREQKLQTTKDAKAHEGTTA